MMALEDKELDLNKEIGQRIQWRRKELGLTQDQVADRTGLTRNFLAAVERGARGLGAESIKRLSNALQISADFIVMGKSGTEDRNHLIELIQPLNSDEIFGLEEIVKVYLKACGCIDWRENGLERP